jgi:hypothetical protein
MDFAIPVVLLSLMISAISFFRSEDRDVKVPYNHTPYEPNRKW